MKKLINIFIFLMLDISFFILLFYFTQFVRFQFNTDTIPEFHGYELKQFLFVILIIITIFFYEKIYTIRYDFWQETYKIYKALFLAYVIVLSYLTLQKVSLDYSRLFISLYFIFASIFIPAYKRLIKKVLYKFDMFKRNVLIIGDKKDVEKLKQEFNNNWYLGVNVNQKNYDSVVICPNMLEFNQIEIMIEKYLNNNDEVYILPYIKNINFANSNIMEYANIRLNTIQIQNKLLKKINIYIKNIFDYILAMLILPIFFIIHIFIVFAIKLDSKGSILFKQKRLGKNNKTFICYKYRTMYEDGDNILKEYLKIHPEEIEYYEKFHKYKNDPRITKIGKFLRKSSLDELPQIINILKGEMSFVGPRPYMVNEIEKLENKKDIILKVKPGITGLWQVSGRNNLTFKDRIDLDIWYIKNWSLWQDFIILIKTIKVVLLKVGAK